MLDIYKKHFIIILIYINSYRLLKIYNFYKITNQNISLEFSLNSSGLKYHNRYDSYKGNKTIIKSLFSGELNINWDDEEYTTDSLLDNSSSKNIEASHGPSDSASSHCDTNKKGPDMEISMNSVGAISRELDVSIEQELEDSFLSYAYASILNRALPDVRDGLKPVQRRILWVCKVLKSKLIRS